MVRLDLERGTLAVRSTLQRIKIPGEEKGALILKEPKRSSRRKEAANQMDAILTPSKPVATTVATKPLSNSLN